MFEKFSNADELFRYKLGSARNMEQTTLEMLRDLQEETHSDQLRELFRHHEAETRQQIENLEEAFRSIGEEPDDSAFPTFSAFEKESQVNLRRTDDSVIDITILCGAMETEHLESAIYESLILVARAAGHEQVVNLLEQNLQMELHTLDELREAGGQIVGEKMGARSG
jgi:ferritin-like metal-binding protein YciE